MTLSRSSMKQTEQEILKKQQGKMEDEKFERLARYFPELFETAVWSKLEEAKENLSMGGDGQIFISPKDIFHVIEGLSLKSTMMDKDLKLFRSIDEHDLGEFMVKPETLESLDKVRGDCELNGVHTVGIAKSIAVKFRESN